MSDFFRIGENETRSIRKGTAKVTVRMVEAATDHVGLPFVVRPAKLNGLDTDTWFRACERCGGWGHYSYNQIDGTVCYGCFGDGLGTPTTPEDAEKLVKTRRATRDRKNRAEFLAAWEAAIAWNAFRAENLDVIEFLAGKEERRGFLGDMAEKAANGIVLSERMVAAVRKIAAEVAGKQAAANAAGHFGEVGKRYEITAVVTNVKECFSDFGVTYLITMRGSEGHTFKTFASGAFADVEKNTEVTFKGTVKGHGEWNGSKETTLTRCMIPKAKKA